MTTLAQYTTLACVAFGAGFVVALVIGVPRAYPRKRVHRPKLKLNRELGTEPETESESESDSDCGSDSDDGIDIDSTDLNDIPGEVRMSLLVRQDLKMGKGKAAAQCAHAALGLYERITNPNGAAYNPQMVARWRRCGQAKIALQVPDSESMDIMFAQAISMGINAHIVHDAGRTQIAAGSATVLGLGPAPRAVIDKITLDLKLY